MVVWHVGEVEVESAGEGGEVRAVECAVDAACGAEDVERLAGRRERSHRSATALSAPLT